MKKLEAFDSIYFRGKIHFENNGTQNYLVFRTVYRYVKTVSANDGNISSWKSKGWSDESIKSPITSNKMLNPSIEYAGTKARVKLNGNCLKQDKITFNHGKIVNIYIVYKIGHTRCRKIVFNQLYYRNYNILFKIALQWSK